MKKVSIVILLLFCTAAGIFATDIGFGIMAGGNFYDCYGVGILGKYDVKYGGFGAYFFFGWKYFDINLGFLYKAGNYIQINNVSPLDSRYISFGSACFQGGAYFKIPIRVSSKLRLFPTIGVDAEIQGYPGDIELWTRLGMGLDVLLKKNMFLRSTALYGVDFFPYINNGKAGHGFLIKTGFGWML